MCVLSWFGLAARAAWQSGTPLRVRFPGYFQSLPGKIPALH
jgi:hypothetical protein